MARINAERNRKIAEMREQNISYRQIAKELGMNQGSVCQISKRLGLDGTRAKTLVHEDPNEYIQKYHPNLEYVSGWTSCENRAVIRCKDCGCKFEYSMKSLRNHPDQKTACPECRKHEVEKEKILRAKERIAERNRKLKHKEEQKQERFWSQEFEQKTLKVCPICRNIFYGNRKYCSDKCSRYRQTQRHHDRRSELIKSRTVDNDITLKGLYEKFNGICWICGEPCDWNDYKIINNAFIAGNFYPSIDHVVAIANGGEHSWKNIKLAHRQCNWERWQES